MHSEWGELAAEIDEKGTEYLLLVRPIGLPPMLIPAGYGWGNPSLNQVLSDLKEKYPELTLSPITEAEEKEFGQRKIRIFHSDSLPSWVTLAGIPHGKGWYAICEKQNGKHVVVRADEIIPHNPPEVISGVVSGTGERIERLPVKLLLGDHPERAKRKLVMIASNYKDGCHHFYYSRFRFESPSPEFLF